jgi:membrane peptidoglycan carboxypeptidase
VYARLTLDVGPQNVAAMAKKLGVNTPLDDNGAYVPSIGLGSRVVTPMDLASAYSTLAAGGIYSKPTRRPVGACRSASASSRTGSPVK